MAASSLRRLMAHALHNGRLTKAGQQSRNRTRWQSTTGRLTIESLEDRCTPSTLQAISLPDSHQPPSDTAAGASTVPSVSADGRYVAFESNAPNLVYGQTGAPAVDNIFLLDRSSGSMTLVSHIPGSATSAPTSGYSSTNPLISRDGRYVVYNCEAPEIAGLPTSGIAENCVVVFDRTTGQNTLVSYSNTSSTIPADKPSEVDVISGDGRYIVFHTAATDAIPGEVYESNPDQPNLFLYDQKNLTTLLVSHWGNLTKATASEGADDGASVADDGSVAYVSQSDNIVGFHGANNIYLYTPATQMNQLISTVRGMPDQAADLCYRAIISSDGSTVTYVSAAQDILPSQASPAGQKNVFRYSRLTGTTTLVSGAGDSATVSSNADSGGYGFSLAISSNGQYIAFASQATNLVAGQSGPAGNMFIYDAAGPTLTLLSSVNGSAQVAAGGVPNLDATGRVGGVADPITGDANRILSIDDGGFLVAYVSQAANIIPGQTGPSGIDNVFLYDRSTGQNSLVSGVNGSATATGNGQSGFPVLSADGVLAFHTLGTNLSSNVLDANGVADALTYTHDNPGNTLVSRSAFVVPKHGGDSFSTSVSADGRYTVFTSLATNLIPNEITLNTYQNVFLYDRETQTTTLVNHVPGLTNTTGDGGVSIFPDDATTSRPPGYLEPVISADGNFITFASYDDNLVPGESSHPGSQGQFLCVYLYDRQKDQIKLVNHDAGTPTIISGNAWKPVPSADGRYVAFAFGGPPAGNFMFSSGSLALYDSLLDTTTTITPASYLTNGGTASDPVISDDGRFVAYVDANNVYLFDRNSAFSSLVSHSSGTFGAASSPVISHDGGYVAFVGQASSSFTNVFDYTVSTGVVGLVSGLNGSTTDTGNGNSDSPAISSDGNYIAYRSDVTNLVTSQTGSGSNIFEFNRLAGSQTLVSHQAGSAITAANGDSSQPVIDDDGHLVSYVNTAGNLIPGQSGAANVKNVFVWLRQTNANILASGQNGSPTLTGNADSDFPLLTRHSFPGFSSVATNLLPDIGGASIAYFNTLVSLVLSHSTIPDGSSSGATVGIVSVSSLLVGQFIPPIPGKGFHLPGLRRLAQTSRRCWRSHLLERPPRQRRATVHHFATINAQRRVFRHDHQPRLYQVPGSRRRRGWSYLLDQPDASGPDR